MRVLNLFLADVYGKGHFIKEGYIPESWIYGNAQFQSCMLGHKPLNGVFAQICGVDLIRDGSGYYVLEDNLRVPSGVSYMMQNRKMMQRLFPDLFKLYAVAPVDHYGAWLRTALRESTVVENPTLAVLTPGPFNSAYDEHAFLAQQMGVELVEGRDLFVQDAKVWMRTIRGPQRVDVLYRRLDDAFLDPLCFRSDSILGVPGLMQAHRAGGMVLANSVGTGVADDKSIYPFVPGSDFICPKNSPGSAKDLLCQQGPGDFGTLLQRPKITKLEFI